MGVSGASNEGEEHPWRQPARSLVPTRTESLVLALVLVIAGLMAIPMFFPRLLWDRPAVVIPADYRPNAANGAYLVHIGGCAYCHTASAAESEPLAGGRRVRTPFGTIYTPNITPHRGTGIGGWSDRDFVMAMRYGLSPANRHYYPAFPYTAYAGMALTDLLDLKAYLDGIPPSVRPAVERELPFPFSFRAGLGLWKLVYFWPPAERAYPPRMGIERGHYVAEAVADCAECHTPRTILGSLINERWMTGTGSTDADVPNITPHRKGIGLWSRDALIAYLKTGIRPDGRPAAGVMAHVIEEMTSRLTDADCAAMADYLRSLSPLATE